MLHEFAVDPEALSNWRDCRYVLDQMGIRHARLLAELPGAKHWCAQVRDAVRTAGCPPREFLRVVERLKRAREAKFYPEARTYHDHNPWLDNAVREHARKKFRAIITEQGNSDPYFLLLSELGEEQPLWAVEREDRVPRNVTQMGSYVSPLVRLSREILFVDPYFDPDRPKWRRLIRHCLEVASGSGRSITRLEYHTNARWEFTEFQNRCAKLMAEIPVGMELFVHRWEAQAGTRFHARYILTNEGGYRFDGWDDLGNTLAEIAWLQLHFLVVQHKATLRA